MHPIFGVGDYGYSCTLSAVSQLGVMLQDVYVLCCAIQTIDSGNIDLVSET